jgi:hypothetical protein
MSADLELNHWRAEWQAQVEASRANSADVRLKAVRQQRRLRAGHLLELMTGVVFLAVSAAVAWRAGSAEYLLWAAVVWLTTVIASSFSLWNWHILWTADMKSVTEFTQEYEKRCRAGLRASRFGKVFVVVQSMISMPWLTWDYHRGHASTVAFGSALLLLILLTVGFWVFFSRYRRAALRELNQIRETRNVP